MNTISILGCGWLGFDLAKSFLTDSNYIIKGSTTTKAKLPILEKSGIIAFLLDTTKDSSFDDILECDILIIAIPPKNSDFYLNFLHTLSNHKSISNIRQILFISSTSIYPNIEKEFKEDEVINDENSSKKVVFQAEQIFLKMPYDVLILRCSGLMGYNRIAGKYFANKTLTCKHERVNYVHKDDVINIIQLLIKKNKKEGIYNLCSPNHPTKEEVYLHNAKKYNFIEPIFEYSKQYKNRIINTNKIIEELGYIYKYNNPLNYD